MWPGKTKKGSRLAVFLLGLITMAEGVVMVLTLGRRNCEWRATFLFSDFIDKIDKGR